MGRQGATDGAAGARGQTPLSRGLALLALVPAALGLALGNPALLVLAAAPAVLLARARDPAPDGTPAAVRSEVESTRLVHGDATGVRLEARVPAGPEVALVHQALPDPFALEAGSNVHLHPGEGERTWRLEARAAARGEWTLPASTITALHPLLLAPARRLAAGEPAKLLAEPDAPPPERVRSLPGPGVDPPGSSPAAHGGDSTEFRDLREYVPGDPVKRVNWKATARVSTRDVELIVNEREPEARQAVWFYLDLHPALDAGPTTGTALDDAVAACVGLVRRLARRGHRVGGATYNGPRHVFHPEAGARRARDVARTLADVGPGDGDGSLAAAAERSRAFLARYDPAVVVLTRPEADLEGLLEGVRRIHVLRTRRDPPPVTVLAPRPPASGPAEAAALEFRARAAREAAAGPGLRVRPIADGARSLDGALAREVPTP